LSGRTSRMQPNSRLAEPVMAALCVAAYLGAAWITADVSPLRPDTPSYLYFDPSRSIGYPFFLWISRQLGGAVLAVPLQMLVLTISLFFLGLAFFRYTGRPVLSVLFQLALLLSPEMWKFAAMLLTEATATAAVALWCVQLLRTVRAPDSRSIGFLAVISGVATLVKPSLVPLFIGAIIPVLGRPSWKQRGWALALIAAGLTTTLAVTPVANLLLHGSADSGSPVARGVLQHTLFCSVSKTPADPESAFVEGYARAVTNYISAAPEAVQPGLKRLYTGKLRFGLIIPTLGRKHGLEEGWRTDALLWRIAKERIAANPGCYARSVLSSYLAISTYNSYSSADSKRLEKFLLTNPPVDLPVVPLLRSDEQLALWAAQEIGVPESVLPGRQDLEPPTGRPLPLIWSARLLYGVAASVGVVGLIFLLAPGTMSPELRELTLCAAALGAAFHGVLLLTSIVELPLMRYTVPLWPVVCTLLGVVGVFIFRLAYLHHTKRAVGHRETAAPDR
jgi:hypothetical protein